VTQQDILALASTVEGHAVIADWYEEQGRLDVARLWRDELPPREGVLRKRVEKLTEEERGRLDEYARRWIAVGRCTQPADRALAEAALLACYRVVRLRHPKRLLWAKSPAEALEMMADAAVGADPVPPYLTQQNAVINQFYCNWPLAYQVAPGVGRAAYEAIYERLGLPAIDAVDELWSIPVGEALESCFRRLHRDNSRPRLWREHLKAWWNRYLGAQYWVGSRWRETAFVTYALDVLRLECDRQTELCARAYSALCESCFLVWPHREFAVLCERPRVLELEGPGETVEEMRQQRLVRAAWEDWEVKP
jgi:hypothetical protein